MHNNWTPKLIRNDIAIITLLSSAIMSANIATIALPSENELNDTFAGDVATASGFGSNSDTTGITTAQSLSHVSLPIITKDVCLSSFWIIQSSNICTSGANGSNTCFGDSGCPLVVIRNNRPLLVGVTSFGSGRGCQIGFPTAFARVTYFMDFITSNL